MAASVAVPLSEYLRTSYSPDCEWVDGEVRERNVGEGAHAMIQRFLVIYLGTRDQEWDTLTLPEQRVQTSAQHYRVPDVCVLAGGGTLQPIVQTPPLLCIEILSREDSMSEMYERVEDYLSMGTRCVWIIDPRRRKGFQSDAEGRMVPQSERLYVPGTEIAVPREELFRQLNQLEGVQG